MKHRNKIRPLKDVSLVAAIKQAVKCLCSGRTESEKFYERSQTALEKELDIVHFVKQSRLVHNLVRLLLSPREQKLIRMQAYGEVVSGNSTSEPDIETNQAPVLARIMTEQETSGLQFTEREIRLLQGILHRHPPTGEQVTKTELSESILFTKPKHHRSRSSTYHLSVDDVSHDSIVTIPAKLKPSRTNRVRKSTSQV